MRTDKGSMTGIVQEKTVAFILARLSSSRLQGKHFFKIGGKTVLQWLVGQLKRSWEIDEIVLTTVAEDANRPLLEYARNEGISSFWYEGDVDAVTTRLCAAAKRAEADICVLVSGDCPLIYGPAIDDILREFKRDSSYDLVRLDSSTADPPMLHGVGIARARAWFLAETLSDRPEYREHHFPVIGLYPERFSFYTHKLAPELCAPFHRVFIDTWADLEFCNAVANRLQRQGKSFNLPETLSLLHRQPDLRKINAHVYQRKVVDQIKRVLLIVDAGSSFGYGHLRRSMELGQQLIERLGWAVFFAVDDPFARQLLESHGLRVRRGAFGRPLQQGDKDAGEWSAVADQQDIDMLILDLAAREVPTAWRKVVDVTIRVVVLDRLAEWVKTADLAIVPGVTANPEDVDRWHARRERGGPEFATGKQCIIIRRQIRRQAERAVPKDIDMLVYLHNPQPWAEVLEQLRSLSWTVVEVDGTEESFVDLLARSRLYFGRFGYSFYEALYLNVRPLALVEDVSSEVDARRFYHEYEIAPALAATPEELFHLVCNNLKDAGPPPLPMVHDGTESLVRRCQKLLSRHA